MSWDTRVTLRNVVSYDEAVVKSVGSENVYGLVQ